MLYDYNEVKFIFKKELQHGKIPVSYTFEDWLKYNFLEVKPDNNGRNYLRLA